MCLLTSEHLLCGAIPGPPDPGNRREFSGLWEPTCNGGPENCESLLFRDITQSICESCSAIILQGTNTDFQAKIGDVLWKLDFEYRFDQAQGFRSQKFIFPHTFVRWLISDAKEALGSGGARKGFLLDHEPAVVAKVMRNRRSAEIEEHRIMRVDREWVERQFRDASAPQPPGERMFSDLDREALLRD